MKLLEKVRLLFMYLKQCGYVTHISALEFLISYLSFLLQYLMLLCCFTDDPGK